MTSPTYGDVSVALENHIALVEIHRPPHNHFDNQLLRDLAEAFRALDDEPTCRALVLASEGKSFCAGADFRGLTGTRNDNPLDIGEPYRDAVQLFSGAKPVIAAVQGAAVGGGLGLSLVADFRVASPESKFVANFVKLGIHPGFGLTHTLPRVIGMQRACLMFYTGKPINGEEAFAWGLADVLVSTHELRDAAKKLASEIAEGAPLAVRSTRATMRRGLAAAVKTHTDHELAEQTWLRQTEDHREGVLAVNERRSCRFIGR